MKETLTELIDKAPGVHELQDKPFQGAENSLVSAAMTTGELEERSTELLKSFEQSVVDFESLNERIVEQKNTLVTATTRI